MSRTRRIPHLPRPSRISRSIAARLGPPAIPLAALREVINRYRLTTAGSPRNFSQGRRSRNVAITTGAGVKVIKQYRARWIPETVLCGHSILLRLEELGFPAPRLVRTPDEATLTIVDDLAYAIFDLIPGSSFASSYVRRADRLRLVEIAGKTLAKFHRGLDGFLPRGRHHLGFEGPRDGRTPDLAWYASTVDELMDRSQALGDPKSAGLATRLRAVSERVLRQIESLDETLVDRSLPRLVIHGDYGLHNLIFKRDGAVVPVDFELSRFDWRETDLVLALIKMIHPGGDPDLPLIEAFVGAYTAEFPLTSDERQLLPDVWRLDRLEAGIRSWKTYLDEDGPISKLAAAVTAIDQATWIVEHPEVVRRIRRAAEAGARGRSGSGQRVDA